MPPAPPHCRRRCVCEHLLHTREGTDSTRLDETDVWRGGGGVVVATGSIATIPFSLLCAVLTDASFSLVALRFHQLLSITNQIRTHKFSFYIYFNTFCTFIFFLNNLFSRRRRPSKFVDVFSSSSFCIDGRVNLVARPPPPTHRHYYYYYTHLQNR